MAAAECDVLSDPPSWLIDEAELRGIRTPPALAVHGRFPATWQSPRSLSGGGEKNLPVMYELATTKRRLVDPDHVDYTALNQLDRRDSLAHIDHIFT